ncbi:MAG: flagellar protein FlgN [Clostridiales bacterium]|jgi:flagellar biosynthesis/type III secretory pathway chaperone|nr:flagellar protein FlgN [Clostridiales bacterium]
MRAMEGLWERLIEILEQESALYRDIFELSKHKTNTIVEGKVTELEQLTGVEQKMLLGIGNLEQQREEAVNQLARHLDVPADQFNISLAIKKAGEDLQDKFAGLKDEISSILKELKEVNDLNSQLIEKSLEYIDFSINLIAGDLPDITYNAKKSGGKDKGGSFFDQKV